VTFPLKSGEFAVADSTQWQGRRLTTPAPLNAGADQRRVDDKPKKPSGHWHDPPEPRRGPPAYCPCRRYFTTASVRLRTWSFW
jgi:hypothetical protein